jgi:hypothetical protein
MNFEPARPDRIGQNRRVKIGWPIAEKNGFNTVQRCKGLSQGSFRFSRELDPTRAEMLPAAADHLPHSATVSRTKSSYSSRGPAGRR